MPHLPPPISPLSREDQQARLDRIVKAAMDAVATAIGGERPALMQHFFYGASAIHPKHLVTWYMFRTDAELKQARKNGLAGRIEELTRAELTRHGYPAEGVPLMAVAFETDETIQRESSGNYWHHFK